MKRFFASAAALAISMASPAAAATLVTNGSGQLTGATGVIVFVTSYDVEFVEGTCASVFDGCDNASDFAFFQNQSLALMAAQALLDQVFIGAFDTDYTLTFGCEFNGLGACEALIPILWGAGAVAINNNGTSDPPLEGGTFDTSKDSGNNIDGGSWVYARFTPSAAAVPEPSTWAMMLLGFAAIGASLRRRQRKLLQLA